VSSKCRQSPDCTTLKSTSKLRLQTHTGASITWHGCGCTSGAYQSSLGVLGCVSTIHKSGHPSRWTFEPTSTRSKGGLPTSPTIVTLWRTGFPFIFRRATCAKRHRCVQRPEEPKTEQLKIFPGQNSLILKAKSLNVRIFNGIGQPNLMGVQFGVSPPYCHVVRHGGRCYLFNGYQRAVGLRFAGITHMPCILRDVKDHADVGLNPPAFFRWTCCNPSVRPPLVTSRKSAGIVYRYGRIIESCT
jgi:hypothetical protein